MRIAVLVAVIVACVVLSVVALATTPAPIYMSNGTLGGGKLNDYTLGVAGGTGANNIGLLIRTYGKVTYVDTTDHYFYIDDGTGRMDGTRRLDNNALVLGVRVTYNGLASGVPAITPPLEGDKVVVTGIISTCLVPETTGLVRPNVRVRRGADILRVP